MSLPTRKKDALCSFGFIENIKTVVQDLESACESNDKLTYVSIDKTFEEKQKSNDIIYG